jgi:hypothetical protein
MPLVSWRDLDNKAEEEDWGGAEDVTPTEAPNCVKAVPRLSHDMSALLRLMGSEKLPLKRVRAKASAKVYYGFGDASGCGFGATLQIGDEIIYEYGQ